ncbi:MAG: radical SAM protein [Candidatus Omnitrophota bacterium]
MKILLVKPYNLSDHIQPSLGLGYLAASVRGKHDVRILDCIKERIKPDAFRSAVSKYNPDMIGIQCYTFDIYNVREMLAAVRNKNVITVLGGPHPSTDPAGTMEFFKDNLDYAFVGEAEIGFSKLADKIGGARNFINEEINGLVWRDNGHVRINERSLVKDLDSLGSLAWDLIRPETYPEAQHGAFFRNFPIAPIIVTRGCPFSCTFCAGNLISGKTLRTRGVRSVLDEIVMLRRDYGIREFHVIDDNFTMNREFAKELLKGLKALDLGMSWAVPNGIRMDTVDDELLDLMKETGLYLVSLGIESGSDRVLKLMKKSLTTGKVRQQVRLIRSHGLEVAGFFILGFPGETVEDIKKTIAFSLELDLIRANFFTYLPFPGTESYAELKKSGKLDDINLKRFYFMNATFVPDGMDAVTLKRLQRSAFMRFFLRPRIFIKNLAGIKSFNHFRFLLSRFMRWMFLK